MAVGLASKKTGILIAELKRLAENIPAMLAVFDAESFQCLYANERYATLAVTHAQSIVGLHFAQIVGEDAAEAIRPYVEQVLREKRTVNYVRSIQLPSGELRDIEVSLVPDESEHGLHVHVLAFDITRYRAAERALAQSGERVAKFMAASEEGIAIHVDGMITDVNESLARMLGYEVTEFVGRSTLEFVPREDHERVRAVIASGREVTYESRAIHKVLGPIPVEYIVRNMIWEDVKQRMVIVRDLTERKASEQRLRFLALHDSLSGLPNRASLVEHIATLIARVPQRAFATLFIDVDQLKRVNDSLGHAAGDTLLVELSERLSTVCSAPHLSDNKAWLARIGGDEFVIAYSHHDRVDLERFVATVVESFTQPFRVERREIHASASIGIAIYPHDGTSSSQLLKNADAAMYLAKKEGRDTVRYFDTSLARRADELLEIEQALAVAVTESQFRLYFQPLLSSDGRDLIAAEALIRWQHPTRGLIGPNEFIQIAEESFFVQPIARWVLAEALRNVKRWISLGWEDARVSVNLSNHELRDSEFAERVLDALKEADVDGRHLELEFTERMLMEYESTTQSSLTLLKAAEVVLAIDDFGTSFSSLLRLRSLPVDQLKIDQGFVVDIPASHEALTVITAILQLGRGLGLDIVAEGVETEAQRECLELLGCSVMQGYLFARPMPAEAFEQWLIDHRARNADGGARVRSYSRRR